ncbi:hypothetical protein BC940DRAFT_369386 [Gongronella butleri]|nr:hypothetical protein BC940DRAFT_369386 [Gongronella butleri]
MNAFVLENLNSTRREHLAAQRQGTSERGTQEEQNTPENVAQPQNTQQHESQPSLSPSHEIQQQGSHQQELQQQQTAQQQHQAQHGGLELNQPISATFAQALGDFFHHVNVSNADSHDFLQLGADDARHNRELQTMLQWFRDLRNAHHEPSLAGHSASNAGHSASNAAVHGHDTTQGQCQATPGTSQQAAPTDQGQWSANHVFQQASVPGTSAAPVAPTFDDLQRVMDELQSLQNQLAAAKAEILASSQQIDANQSAIQQVCNAMAGIQSKLNHQWTTLNDTAKTMHQYVRGYFSNQ